MTPLRMLVLAIALTALSVTSSVAQQGKATEVYGSAAQVDAGSMRVLVSKIVPNPKAMPNSMDIEIGKQTRFEKVTVADGKKKVEQAKAADAQGHDVVVTLKAGAKPVAEKVTILPEK